MGFRTGAYAKIWEVKPYQSGRATSVRLSISKKVGEGQYEEDFADYCTFIATANKQAQSLRSGDRIKLGDIDVSSQYDRETRTKRYSFKVFSYEEADGGAGGTKAKGGGGQLLAEEVDEDPDDLPF